MVFANVPIKGWVIDPYEQSFFNCSSKVLVLPSNYAEVVDISFVTWDVTVVMNGRGGLLVFFEPFCKGSCRFSYVFFLTPIFTTFESVYDPTFVGNWIFVLGVIRRSFMLTFSSDLEEAMFETGKSKNKKPESIKKKKQ